MLVAKVAVECRTFCQESTYAAHLFREMVFITEIESKSLELFLRKW
jgi:hypothetical protein